MVKGVNKQIIEINDTGNRYFERVLLFVAPGRSGLSDAELQRRAQDMVLKLSEEQGGGESLRARHTKKLNRKRLILGLAALLAAASIALAVFNIL